MKDVVEMDREEFMKDKYYRICNELLRLEVTRGHLSWSVAEVARASDVTRSLIYYYFGKSKEVLLEEASRYMLHTIYGSSKAGELGVKKRTKKVITICKNNPYLFIYWYSNRGKDTSIGKLIKEKEERGFNQIKSYYPESCDTEVLKIQALQLSAVAMQWDDTIIEKVFDR